jgi:hypothetical protein
LRYIKIPETMLPVSDDIPIRDIISFEIGVSIDGPALFGNNGLVTSTRFLASYNSFSENVSKPDLD